jgi:hypothetical protein
VKLRLAQLIMFVVMTGCATGFAQAGPRGRGPRGPGMSAQDAQLEVQDAMQRARMTDSTVQPRLWKQRKKPPAASR